MIKRMVLPRHSNDGRRQAFEGLHHRRAVWKPVADKFSARHPTCAVCGKGEARIPPQTPYGKNPFSVLWNAVVRCIDLLQMHAVTRINERLQQVDHPPSAITGQEAFDVLEKERLWSVQSN